MNTVLCRQRAGWAIVVTAFTPVLVHAQQAPAEPATPPSGLETVVVTGSALGGVRKLEASYNIVTANEEQIRQSNPKSTADLLKISPGMWPESSGGQTGANIEIAGFPGGGDAPFFTTLLMGSPLYGMPTLSFFETSSIIRLDDTVRAVEILQGGPSVVFAGGQMGATANFLLKTGTDEPSGSLGLTYGDENMWRLDGFTGFKVGEGWYGSFGGFYRTSDGVRDSQFPSDEGGQLTATLKRESDKGDLILYARYLNDKNQFITPIPVIQRGTDSFHEYPGFDALTGTYNGEAVRHVRLPGYPGGTTADLADGRGADMWFVGANYDHDFDNGWSISNKFLANVGDADTNALFSGSNPALLSDELYTISTDLGGFRLPAGSATATFVGGGAVAPTQDVIHQGWWFIHKELENYNNDFRLSKEVFTDNTLTIGVYLAYYTMDDKWAQGGKGMLMTNEHNARPITVSYVQGGQTFQLTDDQGFLDYGGFNIAQSGHAFNHAIYLSDSWRLDKWLLDASVRYENQDATNRVCNLSNVNLDGNPLTVYDNAVPQCNGTLEINDYEKDFTSWTVGANYSFTDSMSAYGRVNRGGHFADFDNGIRGSSTNGFAPIQIVKNYEVGFKFQNEFLYADLSTYYRDFTGLSYQQTTALGAPTGQRLYYGSESKGVNFIGQLTLWENFRFQVVANYLDGEYTDYDACVPFTNIVTGNGCAQIEGQQLQRQPKLRYMLTPSYRFPFSWGDIDAHVTYTHVGDRTQDQSGLQQLGSYYTWDFGVVANVGENWQFAVRGTNVSDELGLTESNSRIFGTAAGTNGVLLARPIEGSEVNFQAKYLW